MKQKQIFTFRDAEKQVAPAAFSIMLKPAGSACNLDCHYGYDLDTAVQYGGRQAVMDDQLLELCIKQYIRANEVDTVQFCWHGGEPLLLGLDFYRRAMELQRRYADGKRIEGEDVFELLKDLPGAFEDGKFPVFEATDGRVVIPVTGTGLWGPVWGYVALEKDMDTVAGIIMAHKGETPGLGAEISTPKYQALFVGKKIFKGDEFVSVKLRKGGAQDPEHEVDAISGGTKTSDGVTAMLYNSMEHYLPLLEAKRKAAVEEVVFAPVRDESNEENVENNE